MTENEILSIDMKCSQERHSNETEDKEELEIPV